MEGMIRERALANLLEEVDVTLRQIGSDLIDSRGGSLVQGYKVGNL